MGQEPLACRLSFKLAGRRGRRASATSSDVGPCPLSAQTQGPTRGVPCAPRLAAAGRRAFGWIQPGRCHWQVPS